MKPDRNSGLVPDPYPPFASYWAPTWQHFWGTLASAALLSLGAPFWFNLLKDLSNLRPTLAKKQAQEAGADSDGADQAWAPAPSA